MNTIHVEICPVQDTDVIIPKYETNGSAGCDVRAYIKGMPEAIGDNKEIVIIGPGQTKIIPTGIRVAVPSGFVMDIRPRSGLSAKSSLRIANSPGSVDCDYRNEVGIIVWNAGDIDIKITHNDRIAQLLFIPVFQANFCIVDDLNKTNRTGGFGSTGIK